MGTLLKKLTTYNKFVLEPTLVPFICYTWCCFKNNNGLVIAGLGFRVSKTLSAARLYKKNIPIFGVLPHNELEISWDVIDPEFGILRNVPHGGAPVRLIDER